MVDAGGNILLVVEITGSVAQSRKEVVCLQASFDNRNEVLCALSGHKGHSYATTPVRSQLFVHQRRRCECTVVIGIVDKATEFDMSRLETGCVCFSN